MTLTKPIIKLALILVLKLSLLEMIKALNPLDSRLLWANIINI
jgi:hypothetical protein